MKPTARLADSWWTKLPRIGYTAVALQEHLTRMGTSPFSLPSSRVDSTNLFVPSKKRYSDRRPAYVPDQYRGEA
jgi:hypothetical protein